MTAECKACGMPIDEALDSLEKRAPCPACGSTVRVITEDAHDVGKLVDGYFNKTKRKGYKDPIHIVKDGPNFDFDSQSVVYRHMTIDVLADQYFEIVVNYQSGKVIHLDESALSEHVGHGYNPKKHPST